MVDVGGGTGVLLEAFLRSVPRPRGVLFDREPVVDSARARLDRAAHELRERIQFAPGDFFDAVAAGGDAYVLSRVIHDWDDASAARILTNCRAVVSADARLMLVEAVLPERALDQPAAIRMDLHMLELLGGRERTAAEYARILAAAGLQREHVTPTQAGAGVSVLEARLAR